MEKMTVTNQIFIPTIAEFKNDIATSLELQEPLMNPGYIPGLMLFVRGGRKGSTLDTTVARQYENLESIAGDYSDGSIVVQLPNLPIEEMDFLYNPSYAAEHVKRGIDFARNLPVGSRRVVTHHLNSLVSSEEFSSREGQEWKNYFHKVIRPALQNIAIYAENKGVEVKVETVPVPEFGDLPDEDGREHLGMLLNRLRNPFYLTGIWGFEQIYDVGLGICLDFCHTRTIYEEAKQDDPEKVLFPSDRIALKSREMFDDIRDLHSTDIAHVNDGEGLYRQEEGTVFREGVALGEGDISDLRDMINYLDKRKIPYVLEINETDFNERPNTKKSIDYLLREIDTPA